MYRLGPLTFVIDYIIEEVLQYSPLQTHLGTYRYYSEAYLTQRLAAKKSERRGFFLAGRKHGAETGLFYFNAWMLGEISKELEAAEEDIAIAILFRDSDGTNSSPSDIWSQKKTSIKEGFKRAEFTRGVPMVPRPKSESWFICAAKENPYEHCAELEELSGNDKSPNAAKKMLSAILEGEATNERLLTWLEDNGIDCRKLAIEMPSFSKFYERLVNVLQDTLRKAPDRDTDTQQLES
ncbi:hypothetical protein YA0871_05610 [Pseudomonas paralactis]|uniref:Uncharacterized protein n=1 Tax=Pseudomonas paralactis TaxID=1615673 RepID=A0ABS0UVT6_9PSED|nr:MULTISPECIES: hypothetical protein [Pseudomonas]MBI6632128.1 hypothetical protein [Pseudomonas paralactis]